MWPDVTTKVREAASSLYTALRLASPSLTNDGIMLTFQFPLHQKKVAQAKNLEIVGQAIEEVSGAKLAIRCEVNKNPEKPAPAPEPKPQPKAQDDESITSISNIFGNAEVLES
jgi:hypothetical protein